MNTLIKRTILALVVLPLVIAALGAVAEQLEKRRGADSKSARGMRAVRVVVRQAA